MNARIRYDDVVRKERAIAPFVPFSSHISPDTIITKDGDLMRFWLLGGIAFETADTETIAIRKEQLNTLWRSIASDHVALWSHTIKREKTDRLDADFRTPYSRDLDERYAASFDGYRMMGTDLYLTLVYRPVPSSAARLFRKAGRRSPAEILEDRARSLHRLDQIARQVEAGLRPYSPEVLTTFENASGAECSEPLSLLNYLIDGTWQDVRVPRGPLDEYLGSAYLLMGTETVEIRSANGTRFAQAIDLKDYAEHTQPGMLNGLLYVDWEFTVTQSFSFHTPRQGKQKLKEQQQRLLNVEDASATQIADMAEALDELTAGSFAMGSYHYTIMVYGDTLEAVQAHTNEAMTILQHEGFLASLVATATDAAWYAQLPSNWRYRPRVAELTSRNFAGLACFHNFTSGKRDGNPWGQAVTMFKTPSGQPLYFNFHYATGDEDAFGRMTLANTRVIGQTGGGKTVVMTLLASMMDKYRTDDPEGFAVIYFDHKEGAKIAIKALGGKYQSIKNGVPTGYAPMQIEPTEGNVLFLERLVAVLAGGTLTTADEIDVSDAIRTVVRMPREHRSLSTLLQNLPEGIEQHERETSLGKRLSKWCRDDGSGRAGSLAWVFDNPSDELDFTTHAYHGIDGTDFLDNADARGPLSMYLLHRMDSVIDGRRFAYFMDECQKWIPPAAEGVALEAFSTFASERQLGIRKLNGFGVFATQLPKKILSSPIAAELVEGCATEIYLPNPRAEFKDYVDGFKLTRAEFDIVRELPEESHMFLVKQGQRSMVGKLDLDGFDDDLAILSGNASNNALVDTIIDEIGDDPAVWMPEFHRRRKGARP